MEIFINNTNTLSRFAKEIHKCNTLEEILHTFKAHNEEMMKLYFGTTLYTIVYLVFKEFFKRDRRLDNRLNHKLDNVNYNMSNMNANMKYMNKRLNRKIKRLLRGAHVQTDNVIQCEATPEYKKTD